MQQFSNPSEIARETLKALALRKLLPTPENYQSIYNEIAGIGASTARLEITPILEKVLEHSSPGAPKAVKASEQLRKSLVSGDAAAAESALANLINIPAPPAWGMLVRDLLRLWEIKHTGWTTARKREGLETVLNNFGANPEILYDKIQSLMKSWSASSVQQAELVEEPPEKTAAPTSQQTEPASPQAVPKSPNLAASLRNLLAQTYTNGFPTLLQHSPELAEEALSLAKTAAGITDEKKAEAFHSGLKKFWFKLEMRAGDNAEIQEGLIRLLRLVADNISEIVADDQYLHGQMGMVREIISNPLRRGMLDDAERSLKAVIYKQSMLKQSINEAKTSLKSLIADFIERLGEFSESTGEYHSKIDFYSHRLSESDDIAQITSILDEVMKETKAIQVDTLRSRASFLEAQERVDAANQRIIELEAKLENLSEMVREDHLTRTLNRRGMEEAFEREAARSDRKNSALCVAILDIDDFKKLNDTLGHQAGDDALVYLALTIKEMTRPNDVVSRFGGEEFIIILPDSELEDAVQVITRLQRELTRKIFMYQKQKQVITFSAGVALRGNHESRDSLIERADKAMYEAKQAGKNRVFAAP